MAEQTTRGLPASCTKPDTEPEACCTRFVDLPDEVRSRAASVAAARAASAAAACHKPLPHERQVHRNAFGAGAGTGGLAGPGRATGCGFLCRHQPALPCGLPLGTAPPSSAHPARSHCPGGAGCGTPHAAGAHRFLVRCVSTVQPHCFEAGLCSWQHRLSACRTSLDESLPLLPLRFWCRNGRAGLAGLPP